MKFLKLFMFLFFCISIGNNLFAYDALERFKIVEDKLKTEDMLNPFGHDFLFNTGATLNANLIDFISDISYVGEGASETEKLTRANDMFQKYKNTEQVIRVKLNLGFPLPSFGMFGIKFVPDFRFGFNFGTLIGIREQTITLAQILEFIDLNNLPPEYRAPVETCVATLTFVELDAQDWDIVKTARNKAGCLTAEQSLVLAPFEGQFYFPSDAENYSTLPAAQLMLKAEAKTGFLINYSKDDWFGFLNIAALGRTDKKLTIAADAIAKEVDIFKQQEEPNYEARLVVDYKLGRKIGRYSVFGSVEDLALYKIIDNEEKGGSLYYSIDPLYRLHGDARFEWASFSLTPFVGLHSRSGYDLSSGVYAGADFGAHVWGERLGLLIRSMADNSYFTLAPRIKLWLAQLEYSLKLPIRAEVDGVKISAIHSLDFRIFF